jgi:hypothetical protein
MAARLSTLRVGRLLPPGRLLILISVREWVDPRAMVRLEGLGQFKSPMISSRIDVQNNYRNSITVHKTLQLKSSILWYITSCRSLKSTDDFIFRLKEQAKQGISQAESRSLPIWQTLAECANVCANSTWRHLTNLANPSVHLNAYSLASLNTVSQRTKVWGSHSRGHEEFYLLGCNTVTSQPKFALVAASLMQVSCLACSTTLKTEATYSSEMSGDFRKATQR